MGHRPVVAIVGRQNVGKSTLLNHLAGKQVSIVADAPGTTRDRILADVSWQGSEFTLVDTGGLELESKSHIAREVKEQVDIAIQEADVIIFLLDAKSGVTAADKEIASLLRPANKPILPVVNKADSPRLETGVAEFYELGLGEPIAISAYHGRGTADLLDKIMALLPPPAPVETTPGMIKVAIVGRPNVGKSTLLNTIVGEKRAIVTEIPGTTRDAIDTMFDFNGQNMLLIDTAGIRRRGQVSTGIERYSVIRALRAIERADIVLLVLDAIEGVSAQDTHIAGYIQQAAKGVVLIVNKWDMVSLKNKGEWDRYIRSQFQFLPYAPVLYISAKLGQGTEQIMPLVQQLYQERQKQVTERELNSVIQQATAAHPPPQKGGRPLKIFQSVQTGVNPPSFAFFVSDARMVHFSYQRYLENKLREAFGFMGTPVRLTFKTRRKP